MFYKISKTHAKMNESKNIFKNWNLPPCLQISVNRGGMLFNRNGQVFPFNLKLRVTCDVNQNKSIYRFETKFIIFKILLFLTA